MNIEKETLGSNTYINAYDNDGTHLGKLIISFDVEHSRYKHLCVGDKLAKIVRLETNPRHCGKGIATALLNYAFEEYGDYNLYLLCAPSPRGDSDSLRTVSDLKNFYGRFGFKETGELIPTMIRQTTNGE